MPRPDPRPPKRIVNPGAEPYDRSPLESWWCPLCGKDANYLSRHHVVPRSQGGDDLPENLIFVCGHGTLGCHGVLESRNRDGASGRTFAEVGKSLVEYVTALPPVLGYVERKKWPGWLDDQYGGGAFEQSVVASFNERLEFWLSEGRDPVEAEILAERELGAA